MSPLKCPISIRTTLTLYYANRNWTTRDSQTERNNRWKNTSKKMWLCGSSKEWCRENLINTILRSNPSGKGRELVKTQLFPPYIFWWRGAMPLLKSSKSLTYRGDKTRERYINQIKIFFEAKMNYGWTILIWVAVGLYVFWFLDKVDKKPKRKRRSKKK